MLRFKFLEKREERRDRVTRLEKRELLLVAVKYCFFFVFKSRIVQNYSAFFVSIFSIFKGIFIKIARFRVKRSVSEMLYFSRLRRV